MRRIIFDTNVLLRAAQRDHPDSRLAQESLAVVVKHGDEGCIVPQVLYEFWSVATRPLDRNGLDLSIEQVSALVENLRADLVLLPDAHDLVDRWHELIVRYRVRGKNSHDARLVAAMSAHGLIHIITFNAVDFARYPGLEVLSPARFVGNNGQM